MTIQFTASAFPRTGRIDRKIVQLPTQKKSPKFLLIRKILCVYFNNFTDILYFINYKIKRGQYHWFSDKTTECRNDSSMLVRSCFQTLFRSSSHISLLKLSTIEISSLFISVAAYCSERILIAATSKSRRIFFRPNSISKLIQANKRLSIRVLFCC